MNEFESATSKHKEIVQFVTFSVSGVLALAFIFSLLFFFPFGQQEGTIQDSSPYISEFVNSTEKLEIPETIFTNADITTDLDITASAENLNPFVLFVNSLDKHGVLLVNNSQNEKIEGIIDPKYDLLMRFENVNIRPSSVVNGRFMFDISNIPLQFFNVEFVLLEEDGDEVFSQMKTVVKRNYFGRTFFANHENEIFSLDLKDLNIENDDLLHISSGNCHYEVKNIDISNALGELDKVAAFALDTSAGLDEYNFIGLKDGTNQIVLETCLDNIRAQRESYATHPEVQEIIDSNKPSFLNYTDSNFVTSDESVDATFPIVSPFSGPLPN